MWVLFYTYICTYYTYELVQSDDKCKYFASEHFRERALLY